MDLADGRVLLFDMLIVAGDKMGLFPGVALGDKNRLGAIGISVLASELSLVCMHI